MIPFFTGYNKTIYIYYYMVFLRFFSLSLTVTYGAIYILSHDLSPSWLGYLGSIGSVTILLFEFPTGIISDRYGYIVSITLSLLISGIVSLFTVVCFGPTAFAIITILASIAVTFYSGSAEAWAFRIDDSIKDNITAFYATTSIISNFAKITGGLTGGVISSVWWPDIPFALLGILLISTAIIFYLINRNCYKNSVPTQKNSSSLNFKKFYKNFIKDTQETLQIIHLNKRIIKLIISGFFYIFFTVAPFIYWQPYFYQKTGSTSALSSVWIIFIFAGMIGNHFSKSRVIKLFSPESIFKNTILLSGIFLLSGVFIDNIALSALLFGLYHLFLGILGPTRYMLINQEISDNKRASVLSFISLTESLAGGVGGILYGSIAGFLDIKLMLLPSFIPLVIAYFFASSICRKVA